jgi:excisionase family DNA binding protein
METETHLVFYSSHVAEMLNVSPKTIRRWAKDGDIPFYRFPKNSWRTYRLKDVNWMRRMRGMPELSEKEAIEIYNEMREERREKGK